MQRLIAALVSLALLTQPGFAASGKQPAPPGSFPGAPPEFTKFSVSELSRGFLALAFGSDLLIGKRPKGIRRFDHPIVARVIPGGSVDRVAAMTRIIEEYAAKVPDLKLRAASDATADIEVRMIDEKDFRSALEAAFGARVARTFVKRTDPQCMTSVKSNAAGEIVHSVTFVIVDKGDDVFLDCAYHELLHAFGLSSHDQHNAWTTLNQNRIVGYLTVYDRALLTILYDPRMRPGMTPAQVRRILPMIIKERGLISTGEK
ncbi:MAG TPA: DUF2927 domain-containing protein [Pseudolabrys sp.]|jgi:hypothetical protein|nr:DUF2927 domain-containing protein [Pseudolabrys sp.]